MQNFQMHFLQCIPSATTINSQQFLWFWHFCMYSLRMFFKCSIVYDIILPKDKNV